jgi:hypothetical protein
MLLFDPDFVWKIGNETECVVIEVKSWWSFHSSTAQWMKAFNDFINESSMSPLPNKTI